MDEKRNVTKQDVEVSFKRIMAAVWKRSWMIGAVAIIAAIVTLLGALFFVKPKYESSAQFYVNNSLTLGSLSISDINASRELVNTYITVLMTRSCLEAVIDYADVDQDHESLAKMITADAVNDTEIFRVTVTSTDPVEAQKIADAITHILPKKIDSVIEDASPKIVDPPVLPEEPSSPKYTVCAILGFLIGLVFSASVVVLQEVFDVTIREESDITDHLDYPVLASVPDMTAQSKGGYYRYAYASKQKEQPGKQQVLVGKGISFAASEAYKLLRTKLQFSFADGKHCHVIGVSSAMAGEGKSLSSVNLAYSMSELGKKVLLVDCDLRRPTLAEKLNVQKFPGLSNYLSGLCNLQEVIQTYSVDDGETGFHVMSAGGHAPNPVELLSSQRMQQLLKALREHYDYVILDFPPVGEVSDALALVEETDGILVVVRQNYCNRNIMTATLRQFEFVGARILGIVYNSVREQGGSYAYKKYYSSYGRYAAASRHNNNQK